ncbi:hypothetical protein SUGI_0682710 [Cryptomeria japonica]|uniref:uncharacterized protein At4g15970 n=1 Tax=Cryptomeria japonica TaxID=3369 RepID=UPI002414AF48|nr:uncharacterized protein At4g15970 [Cryptomeria japonica]GLJ33936.1 hypothetical protein SUGI_0682710 [Cryptomeria japonica]
MKGVNQRVVRMVSAFLACIIVVGVVYFAIDEQLQASFTPILISSLSRMQTIFPSQMDDYATDPDIPPYNSSDVTDELKASLSKAANQEKTVIITTLNAAWAQNNSMVDLFLKSFHIGNGTEALLKNLLIVAVDEKALNRCREIHPHCYLMKTEGVDFSGENLYMTRGYLKMMWRRLRFFGQVLERGYNFVFSDADIMWFRDPFTKFSSKTDFQVASNRYRRKATNLYNKPNAGFMYVRSNEKTVDFFNFWYRSKKDYPRKNEQQVLNLLKWEEFRRRRLKFEFLDTKYFGGYCERTKDVNSVCTMHANCCELGLKAKVIDLRNTLSDWEKYKQQEKLGKGKDVLWTSPDACQNSWRR